MFFFPLSNYHFSFECMLLISYARPEVTLVTPLCGTSTQKQFTLQKLRSASACSLFVSLLAGVLLFHFVFMLVLEFGIKFRV